MRSTDLKISYTALLILFLLFSVSQAGTNPVETVLDNGLVMVTIEDHSVPLVAVRICYHVGIKNECPGLTGITSICEATAWQGTKSFKKGEISRIIQSCGGNTASHTDWDVTHFYAKVPSGMLDTVLVLEADRMAGIEMTSEKLLLAKDIIRKKRLAEVESSIYGHINEEFFNLAYRSHPYGHNRYGWPEDIDRMDLDDLKAYYRAYFQPANAMIVIAGDFDSAGTAARVRELFGSITREPGKEWRSIGEPQSIGDRRSIIEGNVGIPVIIIGYRIPGITHPDIPALRLISNILNTGTSSRINQRMVNDEKSAMAVSGGIIEAEDPGLIYSYAILNFDSPLDEGVRQMAEEIERLKMDQITEAELEKAKNRALVDFYRSERTLDDKTGMAATYGMIANDIQFRKKMIKAIKSLTLDDIMNTSQKYFDLSNRIMVIVSPPGERPTMYHESNDEQE